MLPDRTKVSVGPTTIIALVLGVLPGLITIITKAIEEGNQLTVTGPALWLAWIAIGAGAIVLVCRYIQSFIQGKQPVELVKFVPIPHNAAAQPVLAASEGNGMPTVDLLRHLVTENPEAVEQLKGEGVIT